MSSILISILLIVEVLAAFLLIVVILVCNALVNKLTGASLDKGIGGK